MKNKMAIHFTFAEYIVFQRSIPTCVVNRAGHIGASQSGSFRLAMLNQYIFYRLYCVCRMCMSVCMCVSIHVCLNILIL